MLPEIGVLSAVMSMLQLRCNCIAAAVAAAVDDAECDAFVIHNSIANRRFRRKIDVAAIKMEVQYIFGGSMSKLFRGKQKRGCVLVRG